MASGHILVVSGDDRWRRVLEVVLRLGGATTVSRRSIADALDDGARRGVRAVLLDLGEMASPEELAAIRRTAREGRKPTVIILPERLAGERERFASDGATVLVRPYRPSELYRALGLAADRPTAPPVPTDAVAAPASTDAADPDAPSAPDADLERRTAADEPVSVDGS